MIARADALALAARKNGCRINALAMLMRRNVVAGGDAGAATGARNVESSQENYRWQNYPRGRGLMRCSPDCRHSPLLRSEAAAKS
jgi:hypothetical protein